ncbi:MAG: glutamine-hydrolyzing carbamoyl-phosphate synthase small subunit [Deltaproteobacteria bacterium]|nr:glutamine-hydrolyzing carbamoyl-phosphate synthase small subunit [Deltaproteobacteria bacterium]
MSASAVLALADGTVFRGRPFGHRGVAVGEVCFNTGMTGYQEVLTDPSYRGQIVAMTAPQIGNTGVNREDLEAERPALSGFIVRERSPVVSSHRALGSLDELLEASRVVGVEGIDTRALTRHIRDNGAMMGVLASEGDPAEMVTRARAAPGLVGRDLVREVTCTARYAWAEGRGAWGHGAPRPPELRVVAVDFGVKRNILRCLVDSGCRVTVVPATTSAAEILASSPDGVFLSNGPGDPAAVPYAAEMVRSVLGKKPIFGICLGHQILALARGAKSYKLKFGHRGINQPVMDLETRKVEITTQNHGFAIDGESLSGKADVTHLHLNDRTVEGLRLRDVPAFSVQYHPEASAGPHDALYLFDRFVALMRGN